MGQVFNGIGTALSLLSVPLYLRWMGTERYGLLLTGLAFGGYLMFSDAGLSLSSMLLIAQANGRDDRTRIVHLVWTSVSLAACSVGLLALVVGAVWLAVPVLERETHWRFHPDTRGLLLAVGLSVAVNVILSPAYNLFNGLQQVYISTFYKGIARTMGTFAGVGTAYFGVSTGKVLAANAAASFAFSLLGVVHCMVIHRWVLQRSPFWDAELVREQLRTGVKSLVMQIGGVLAGTAPVLAVSSAAGAAWVPPLSIALTLLNAPLSVLSEFNASLQAGYGESVGRGQSRWVADTVRKILRIALVFFGMLGCGFFLLAIPFVRHWTGGRLIVTPPLLSSALLITLSAALLNTFRFALSGMNRHKTSAVSDLALGLLSIPLAIAAVHRLGYDWVGVGIFAATMLTSGWFLPAELRRVVGGSALWPRSSFYGRLLIAVAGALAAGGIVRLSFGGFNTWAPMIIATLVVSSIYIAIVAWLLPDEAAYFRRLLNKIVSR